MSGFEVVGVVLSTLPLLIAALEGYQKLGKRRDAFARRSMYVGRIVRALAGQQQLIQGDVEVVLRNAEVEGLSFPADLEIGKLQPLLNRDDVQQEVIAFLGSNYKAYLEVLADCERILFEVAKAIPAFAKGSWVVDGSLHGMLRANHHLRDAKNDFWKRVQFGMKKDELLAAIKELDDASVKLSRFSQQSLQNKHSTILLPSRKSKSVVALLRRVRERSSVLHSALSRCWGLHCHASHRARLHLETRLGDANGSKGKVSAPKTGTVTFRVTFEPDHARLRSLLYTCDVHALGDDVDDHNVSPLPPTAGRVNFGPAAVHHPPKPQRLWVDSVCRIVNQAASDADVLKLFVNGNAGLQYCHLPAHSSAGAATYSCNPAMMSLQQILESSPVEFSLRPRVKMAALVASSIMQLYATPWTAGLSKDDIFFALDNAGNIDFQYPFISCQFDNYAATSPPNNWLRQEWALLELGIVIMELWLKQPIESFAVQANLSLGNTYDTRQIVARKWLVVSEDHLVPSVYNAALHCINCRFDAAVIDLSNTKLNQSIFELVVRPLWENC